MTARRDVDWMLVGVALAALVAPACEHPRAVSPAQSAAPAPARAPRTGATAASGEPARAATGAGQPPRAAGAVAEPPQSAGPAPSEIARAPLSSMPEYSVRSAPIAGASSSVAGRVFKPGAVEMIQQRLESVGALRLQEATGGLGAATRSALARFQETNHLFITGEPDDDTLRKLGLNPKNIFEDRTGEE